MKTAITLIDTSNLPEQARTELHDFYHFLVGKYVRNRKQRAKQAEGSACTASALAASPLAGFWKDRDMPDSPILARSLRESAQNRHLS